MPGSPVNFIADVATTSSDASDLEEEVETSSSSSTESVNGALIREGAGSEVGQSRTSSMRGAKQKERKVLPAASADGECSPDDIAEAQGELCKAVSSHTANLHSLHLGFIPGGVKDLFAKHDLRHLRELVLSDNGITSLPHNIFDRMPSLEKLDLTNNKLTMVPMSAMTLRKLQTLLLDHNHITSIPATYDIAEPLELPELHTIGLEWNRLTEFPSHLHDVAPKLRKIYICENLGIQNLPPLSAFPEGSKTEVRLDNRPTLLEQFARGGYESRITPDWNKIYPDKVMDYVYLGSLRTAQCNEVYRDLDIKYVLTAGRNLDVYLPEGMVQLELPLDDVPGENISLFFKDAFDFIDRAIAERKGVLIHCFAGLSRSVTVMVAYLMKVRYPMTMKEALMVVKQARPNSHPNDGFIRSLQHYEEQLDAENNKP